MAWNPGFYPGYNPQQTYIPQMPVQAPQSSPGAQGMNNTSAGFRCFPVTSQAQAETAQIPFDGSTTYFVDTSNGKIYAKTFDFNTGAAPLVAYVREVPPVPVQYVTLEQFEALAAEIERMKKPTRKAAKNDESDE